MHLLAAIAGSIAIVGWFLALFWKDFIRPGQLKRAYRKALEQLSRDPDNYELYNRALSAGRAYSASLIDWQQHYPEEAIRNDLEAATRRRRTG